MRLHAIARGSGSTPCPHCGRPELIFRRENGRGDFYVCSACGGSCLHLQGEHFHGVWFRKRMEEVVAVCSLYMTPTPTLLGGQDAGGIITAARQLSSLVRSPRPCPDCSRRGVVYGRRDCATCRAQLLSDLGDAAEQGFLRRFTDRAWSSEAASEIRRLFGVER